MLNTLGYFAAPALGPCMLNLLIIICASIFRGNVFGLAAGILLGGIAQLAIQIPPLWKNGWRPAITKNFSHPKAKKIGALLVPRALGGQTTWQNVVTACSDCNLQKGGLAPKDAGMWPAQFPFQPSVNDLHRNGRLFPPNYLHESWLDYLYWDTELEP